MIIEIALGIVLGYVLIRLLPFLGCLFGLALIVAIIALIGVGAFALGAQVYTAVIIVGAVAFAVKVVQDQSAHWREWRRASKWKPPVEADDLSTPNSN